MSSDFAVNIIIGTCENSRIFVHASSPSSRGIIRSTSSSQGMKPA